MKTMEKEQERTENYEAGLRVPSSFRKRIPSPHYKTSKLRIDVPKNRESRETYIEQISDEVRAVLYR